VRSLDALRALGTGERRLLAACLIAIPAIVLGLRLLGLRRVRAAMASWQRIARVAPAWAGDAASARARVVARVAGIAAGRGPVKATCLHRSLLIWWLLRREGIETALRIGVRREDGELLAHAWVEHDGVPLGEADDHLARYESFDRDFSLAPEIRR
jgi:hypothetical protein